MTDDTVALTSPFVGSVCETAVDLARLGMWSVNLKTSEVVLSETAARLYGLASLTPIPLVQWRERVSADDRSRVMAAFDTPGEASGQNHRLEMTSIDGQEIHLEERWRVSHDENGQPSDILGIVSDVSGEVCLERRRRELIHELQHRMKNMLAVVRSIARRTAAHTVSLEDFSAHFEGRLAALASIQATLARTQSGQADLEDIVRQELVHSVGSDEGIEVEGPTILLKGRTVELIALALHELAANAVKFGALSTGGRLAVTWTHAPTAPGSGQNLILSWKETGVASADPDHAGFGLELIKRGLPYELDADVAVDFTPTGLECTILLPLGRGGA